MNVEQFDFDLPEELIAQKPLKDRTASKLLVLNKETEEIKHESFPSLLNYLKAGDCLVLNDTRVLPARLFGEKSDTGAKIEVLLLKQLEADTWETIVKRAKKVQVGTEVTFGDGSLKAICLEKKEMGGCIFRFEYEGIFLERLEALGEMPLPPYIKEQLSDKERYQTVYAKEEGSAAAPTAGLHFTKDVLQQIEEKGVSIVYLTLHVGLGTFRPVSVEDVTEHEMHAEYYDLSKEAAETLNNTRANNGRIIAVGTTSARTLETVANTFNGHFQEASGWTDIFIYPPYEFKGIDGLLTNFHLPKSTLVMLVSAFASKTSVMNAYEAAIKHKYRFFSFGDAMLIIS